MKAFILAAGLGTRLKPWTERHPKALVPVGGVPMLERVILKLKAHGFDNITINIHHFDNQIRDFLSSKEYGVKINLSDESNLLLDTGGGIIHARQFLCQDTEPFLVHNVDILTDANLEQLMLDHKALKGDATLLVSERKSSRQLVFYPDMHLKGWININTQECRPKDVSISPEDRNYSFSGIHVLNPSIVGEMINIFQEMPFPIMDYYLSIKRTAEIQGVNRPINLFDIGKNETLRKVNLLLKEELEL